MSKFKLQVHLEKQAYISFFFLSWQWNREKINPKNKNQKNQNCHCE